MPRPLAATAALSRNFLGAMWAIKSLLAASLFVGASAGVAPEAASMLGLQRGVLLQRKVAPPLDEGSVPGVAGAGRERDVSEARKDTGPEAEAVSMLGLQRGVRLQRKVAPPLDEGAARDSAGRGPARDTSEARSQVAPEAVSMLGLQRGVRLQRAPAPLEEEEVELDLAGLSELPESEAFSLAEVSVLGLQRSAKIIRRQPRAVASPSQDAGAGASAVPEAALASLQTGAPRMMRAEPKGAPPRSPPGAVLRRAAALPVEDGEK